MHSRTFSVSRRGFLLGALLFLAGPLIGLAQVEPDTLETLHLLPVRSVEGAAALLPGVEREPTQ